ncbi:MAG: multidrug effflux MFS transporter, partial [Rhodospirillales bacterium]|nr:multidrug effflux MFS transporter [Rhodospirillales bacterium]
MSLVAMSTDSILPALTAIGAELGVADANRAQLVISALFLGLGLGQMVYGPLSDRFGRRPAIQLGLALFLLGSVLSIVADSFAMMLAGRVLQGLGVAGPRIVTVAMVRDRYAGADMARIMSLVMSLFVLVPVVAPTVGQVIFSLVGPAGSVFWDQEPMYPSEDGHDKGSEKKAATRLLQRMAESHLLDLIDVVVCDALYADAEFIRTATSYNIMPIIRIKQENYNIMKEVTDLGEHLSFSKSDYDDERKRHYQYRVFEHLTHGKLIRMSFVLL